MRTNAPVAAARAAEVKLRGLDSYRAGEAVAADLDGARFAAWRSDLPLQGPQGAAAALANMASEVSFTFLDVWTTDALGHAQDRTGALRLLRNLDLMLSELQQLSDELTIVVSSDHGNLEDLSSSRHTRNPVPLLVLGRGAERFAGASSILDVAPTISQLWREAPTGASQPSH